MKKNWKRIAACVLTLCLMLTLYSPAFAAGGSANLSMSVDQTTVDVGDTVTVTVTMADCEVATLTGGIKFDTSKFECASITNGNNKTTLYVKWYDDVDEEDYVNVAATAQSTVADANSNGQVGFAFAGTVNHPYEQRYGGGLMVATFTATAAGTADFTLYEDFATQPAGGTDAYKADPVGSAVTVTINGAVTPKTDPTASDFEYDLAAVTYNGSEQPVAVAWKAATGTGAITVKYNGETTAPKNADTYAVTIDVAEDENYAAATDLSLGNYFIQKADPVSGDFTNNIPAATSYTGDPVDMGDKVTSAKEGMGAVTVKYNGSTTAPTDAGDYPITVDVAEGDNYNAVTGLDFGTMTINPIDYDGTKTFSETVASDLNTSATVALTLPDGASFGVVSMTNGDDLLAALPTITGTSTLNYSTNAKAAGATATVTVPVTGATNYNDFEYTITITAQDKEDANVTIDGGDQTFTYGGDFEISAGAANNESNGTWTWTSSDEAVVKPTASGDGVELVGAGTANVTATYESANYKGSDTVSVTVNPKDVTITGITATSRAYDGTTDVVVSGGTVEGKVGSDDVTVDDSAATAAFADKNVGTGKAVTLSGYALAGAAAGNYNLSAQPSGVTADITALDVTVTGITATSRVYDETDVVALDASGAIITGVLPADTVTVDISGATATVADANAGTGKAVTVSGVALGGTDVANYNLTAQPTGITVDIAKATYGDQTATGEAKYGKTGSVDLSDKLVDGATAVVGTVTDANTVLSETPAVTAGTLNFKFVDDDAKVGSTATVTVNVTSGNYEDYTVTVTLTVLDKLANTMTFPTTFEATYGDTGKSVTASNAVGAVSYAVTAGDAVSVDAGTGAITVLKAGTATITATAAGDDDYAAADADCAVTVNPADLTVAAKAQNIRIGGTAPDLSAPVKGTHYTVTGLVGDDELGGTVTMKYQQGGADVALDDIDTSAAGNYDIIIEGATAPNANYNAPTFTNAKLTISAGSAGRSESGSAAASTDSTTTTDENGTTTTTTKNEDGTTTAVATAKDGTKATTVSDKDGNVTSVDAAVSSAAASEAASSGEPVTLPTEVKAADSADSAAEVEVSVPPQAGAVDVEIPVENVGPGTVVYKVNEDGTKELVKDAVVTEDGVVVTVEGNETFVVVNSTKGFVDVDPQSWAYDAIMFVTSHGIFNGTSEGHFSPKLPMTRGMVAQILYNFEANAQGGGDADYSDVDSSDYYNNAVDWCSANGIITGYPDGTFRGDDEVTREDFAVMLYRYAKMKGLGFNGTYAFHLDFPDAGNVSDYAQEAISWMVMNGVIIGSDGYLLPGSLATREQIAMMMMRFVGLL